MIISLRESEPPPARATTWARVVLLFSAIALLGLNEVRTSYELNHNPLSALRNGLRNLQPHGTSSSIVSPETTVCQPCIEAHIRKQFSCAEMLNLQTKRGNVTLEAAQKIVSDEFVECAPCNPNVCMPSRKQTDKVEAAEEHTAITGIDFRDSISSENASVQRMELSTRQHDPAEVVGTPTARVDLEDKSDKIEAGSADDLCGACKSAHVGLYFTCPERIEGYRSNGNVTLVAAQRIVSDEFDQCNACHPDICLPGQKSQEEMKELPTPVHVTETPALNNIQTPEEADDGRTNDTVDESGQDNEVEIGGTDPTTVEAAPPVPAGVEDNSVQTNILEPSQPLDSAEKEDKPAPDTFGSIEMLCEKCKIATVGVYFTCVQRIEQYMKDNAALEEAQKTVSGEFEQCAVCDPASCRSLPFS